MRLRIGRSRACAWSHAAAMTWVASVALLAGAPEATAAPPGVRRVHVLHLAASQPYPYEAIKLTKALESRLASTPGARLVNSNVALLDALDSAKCAPLFVDRALGRGAGRRAPLDAAAGELLDTACQRKLAAAFGSLPSERYVWGWLFDRGGGRPTVTVRLWQHDGPSLEVTLPYDASAADAVAERLTLRLLEPERVGDVTVVANEGAQGTLVVDDVSRGAYRPAFPELTLLTGEHTFELRRDGRVVARAAAAVRAGVMATVTLLPVAESPSMPTSAAPTPPPTATPSVRGDRDVAPPTHASTLPWVLGGVAVAGLAGAGVFVGLRQTERNDLQNACAGERCPSAQRDAIDRTSLYGTLSLASLGVGIASAGVATYLLVRANESGGTASRVPRVTAGVYPLPGGFGAALGGRF